MMIPGWRTRIRRSRAAVIQSDALQKQQRGVRRQPRAVGLRIIRAMQPSAARGRPLSAWHRTHATLTLADDFMLPMRSRVDRRRSDEAIASRGAARTLDSRECGTTAQAGTQRSGRITLPLSGDETAVRPWRDDRVPEPGA